jgi:hypothetical protein
LAIFKLAQLTVLAPFAAPGIAVAIQFRDEPVVTAGMAMEGRP